MYKRSSKALMRLSIVLVAMTPLLLASDCESDGLGGGGVVSIISGVIELVLGILSLT